MTGGGTGVIGIGVVSGATLDVRGIVISASKKIAFAPDKRRPDWEGIPVGIGFLEDHTDTRFTDCRIDALTITKAPAIAFAMGLGRGVFRNIVATPRIIDCGMTQAKHVNDLHRTAIFSSSARLEGNITLAPSIEDTGPRRNIVNSFVLDTREPSHAAVQLAGSLQILGSVSGYGDTISILSRHIIPRINFRQNFGFYLTRPVVTQPGSTISNASGDIVYRFRDST